MLLLVVVGLLAAACQAQDVCKDECAPFSFSPDRNTCGGFVGSIPPAKGANAEPFHQGLLFDSHWQYEPSNPNWDYNHGMFCYADGMNRCTGSSGIARVCNDTKNIAMYQETNFAADLAPGQCNLWALNPSRSAFWCDVLTQAIEFVSTTANQCENAAAGNFTDMNNSNTFVSAVITRYCANYPPSTCGPPGVCCCATYQNMHPIFMKGITSYITDRPNYRTVSPRAPEMKH